MDNTRKYTPKAVRLIDQVREALRFHHYAYSIEQSYVSWILKYIRFHNKKHPKDIKQASALTFFQTQF